MVVAVSLQAKDEERNGKIKGNCNTFVCAEKEVQNVFRFFVVNDKDDETKFDFDRIARTVCSEFVPFCKKCKKRPKTQKNLNNSS